MTEMSPGRTNSQSESSEYAPLSPPAVGPANEDLLSELKVPSHIKPGELVSEHLVLIGGGAKPTEALETFVGLAGGSDAKILVITWATLDRRDAHLAFDALEEQLGSIPLKVLDESPPRHDMSNAYEKRKFLRQLDDATGVFFTGGDQARIMQVLEDKELLQALHDKFERGAVFSGTSAGTAIMSERMILGGDKLDRMELGSVKVGDGIGLLKDALVDQHFLVRGRMQRLMAFMKSEGRQFGIGVDEDGAVLVEDSRYVLVLGDHQITLIELDKTGRFHTAILEPGESFDIRSGEYIARLEDEPRKTGTV